MRDSRISVGLACLVGLAAVAGQATQTPSSTKSPLGISTICTPGLGIIQQDLFGRNGSTALVDMGPNASTLVMPADPCALPSGPQHGYKLTLPADVTVGTGQLVVDVCVSSFDTLLAVGLGCPYSTTNFRCSVRNDNVAGCGSGGYGSLVTINYVPSLVVYIVVSAQNSIQVGWYSVRWRYVDVIPSQTPSITGTPTLTPTRSSSLSATLTPSITPSGTGTISPSLTCSVTASVTKTPSETGSVPDTPSATGSLSRTPSGTGSSSRTPSNSGSLSRTPSNSRTGSITSSASRTASITGTATVSRSGSITASLTRTHTRLTSPSGSPNCVVGGQLWFGEGIAGSSPPLDLVPGRRAQAAGGLCDGYTLDPALPSVMVAINTWAGRPVFGIPPGGTLFVDICVVNATNASVVPTGPELVAGLGLGCPVSFPGWGCVAATVFTGAPPGVDRPPCPGGNGTAEPITLSLYPVTAAWAFVYVQGRGSVTSAPPGDGSGSFVARWEYQPYPPTSSETRTGTLTPSGTSSFSRTPVGTPSQTASITLTSTQTRSITGTPSQTPSRTGTSGSTPSTTSTPSFTPSVTGTPSGSQTGTGSSGATGSATRTSTSSVTSSVTPTSSWSTGASASPSPDCDVASGGVILQTLTPDNPSTGSLALPPRPTPGARNAFSIGLCQGVAGLSSSKARVVVEVYIGPTAPLGQQLIVETCGPVEPGYEALDTIMYMGNDCPSNGFSCTLINDNFCGNSSRIVVPSLTRRWVYVVVASAIADSLVTNTSRFSISFVYGEASPLPTASVTPSWTPSVRPTNMPAQCAMITAGNTYWNDTGLELVLTRPTQLQSGNGFWYDPLPVDVPWSVGIAFRITNPGPYAGRIADGFTFVLHRDVREVRALGTSGESLALLGIRPSIALVIDTFNNSMTDTSIAGSRPVVGLAVNGTMLTANPAPVSLVGRLFLEQGGIWYATLTYSPASSASAVPSTGARWDLTIESVGVSPATQLFVPLPLPGGRNLSTFLGGFRSAWVGFTASTGGQFSRQSILSWRFNASSRGLYVGCPTSVTALVASPTPTISITPSASETASETASSSATSSETASPSATTSSTATGTQTGTSSRTSSGTGSGTGSSTGTATASRTSTGTGTPSLTGSPTPTVSMSASGSAGATQTSSSTITATASLSISQSSTPSSTSTASAPATRSATASGTAAATGSGTATATGSATLSSRPTDSGTGSGTVTGTGTGSLTVTPTGSLTAGSTPSSSVSGIPTDSSTVTPSLTASGTPAATASATLSSSITATGSLTSSLTPSSSVTASVTGSQTGSPSQTGSSSGTGSSTRSGTGTGSLTSSPTPSVTASQTASSSRRGCDWWPLGDAHCLPDSSGGVGLTASSDVPVAERHSASSAWWLAPLPLDASFVARATLLLRPSEAAAAAISPSPVSSGSGASSRRLQATGWWQASESTVIALLLHQQPQGLFLYDRIWAQGANAAGLIAGAPSSIGVLIERSMVRLTASALVEAGEVVPVSIATGGRQSLSYNQGLSQPMQLSVVMTYDAANSSIVYNISTSPGSCVTPSSSTCTLSVTHPFQPKWGNMTAILGDKLYDGRGRPAAWFGFMSAVNAGRDSPRVEVLNFTFYQAKAPPLALNGDAGGSGVAAAAAGGGAGALLLLLLACSAFFLLGVRRRRREYEERLAKGPIELGGPVSEQEKEEEEAKNSARTAVTSASSVSAHTLPLIPILVDDGGGSDEDDDDSGDRRVSLGSVARRRSSRQTIKSNRSSYAPEMAASAEDTAASAPATPKMPKLAATPSAASSSSAAAKASIDAHHNSSSSSSNAPLQQEDDGVVFMNPMMRQRQQQLQAKQKGQQQGKSIGGGGEVSHGHGQSAKDGPKDGHHHTHSNAGFAAAASAALSHLWGPGSGSSPVKSHSSSSAAGTVADASGGGWASWFKGDSDDEDDDVSGRRQYVSPLRRRGSEEDGHGHHRSTQSSAVADDGSNGSSSRAAVYFNANPLLHAHGKKAHR